MEFQKAGKGKKRVSEHLELMARVCERKVTRSQGTSSTTRSRPVVILRLEGAPCQNVADAEKIDSGLASRIKREKK